MELPDIVIAHSNPASGSAIRDRLRAEGYKVAEPVTRLRSLQPGSLALIDALLIDDVPAVSVPFILLSGEHADVEHLRFGAPEAIVSEPLRGRELERSVRLALHRLEHNIDRALVQSNRHYALFMLDAQGMIASWNPGAVEIHGYEPEEIIGRHFSVFYPDEDRNNGIPDTELQTAAREGVADDTRWLKRRNGDCFWAEGLTTAVRDRGGSVIGFAKITRDATERRKLENQLERSNEELQRFAYTVSHDLQEPLRTVRSYAELLERRYKGQLDSDADEFIRFMIDAAARMTQLLRDLLAYSQAGRADRTTPEPTSSANILQWAIMNVDRLTKDSGAVITYDPLPMVEADQTQLSQVFQNLLSNAIKYRSEEPPRIHVSVQRRDNQYEFAVSDNGIGVPPQHHERVFGVFKRLHGKEVPGTGIGLAICRKIIESHGGSIWLESESEAGVVVKFTLPAYDPPER
jgi:PAS domain S-box-containing protein